MATVKIEFKTDNAAFEEGLYPYEVARVLNKATAILQEQENAEFTGGLLDVNGNFIGTVSVKPTKGDG